MPASKPYVIGLTGGIGCGKSEAAKYLKTLGAVHIDADAVSRALTGDPRGAGDPVFGAALPEVRRAFGDGVFTPDGALDRPKLAARVFADPAARRALEGILHPLVQRTMLERMDAAGREGARVVILDVPLLFETGMDALCDETWVVYADREQQIARVLARDGLTREEAEARVNSQLSSEARIARATCAVSTDRPIEKTRAELEQLYRAAQKRAEA